MRRSSRFARVSVLGLCGCAAWVTAVARQDAPPPAPGQEEQSLEEAMRIGEQRRVAAREAALRMLESGDPLDAFLALDRAMELAPADAELLRAKKKIETDAVNAGLRRAARMGGEGDIEGAYRLLGALRIASDDERLPIAWRQAKAEFDEAVAKGTIKPRAEQPAPDAAPGAGPGSGPELTSRGPEPLPVRGDPESVRELQATVRELTRRLDRLSTSPTVAGKAEPAVDSLERRFDEAQRNTDRLILELRRDVDQITREMNSLRREVDRVRTTRP